MSANQPLTSFADLPIKTLPVTEDVNQEIFDQEIRNTILDIIGEIRDYCQYKMIDVFDNEVKGVGMVELCDWKNWNSLPR